MKKIMFVFGTHPETIKMCTLVKVFKKPYAVFETTDRVKNLLPLHSIIEIVPFS